MRTLSLGFLWAFVAAFVGAGCSSAELIVPQRAALVDGGESFEPQLAGVPKFAEGSFAARAILGYINAKTTDATVLERESSLPSGVAMFVANRRAGGNPFRDLHELYIVPGFFDSAWDSLLAAAIRLDYFPREHSVIFSPQSKEQSQTAYVAYLIDAARVSVDVAMFSHTDRATADALERAAKRGVRVRYLLDDARRRPANELDPGLAGHMEKNGVAIRYVLPGVHHKFVLVDGPEMLNGEGRASLVSIGSANLSVAGSLYADENTLFFSGNAKIAGSLQAEFAVLWNASVDYTPAGLPVTPLAPSSYVYDPALDLTNDDVELAFTSANYERSADAFSLVRHNSVAERIASLIAGATSSIDIASRYMRTRLVAEAVLAKHAASPEVSIRVLIDQEDFVNGTYAKAIAEDTAQCLVAAGQDAAQIEQCNDRGQRYGYALGKSGIATRYKFYAYDFDYMNGRMLHDKFIVIDGSLVVTGSYNLTYSSECTMFENIIILRGSRYADLVSSFSKKFAELWSLGADGEYNKALQAIATANPVPMVFDESTGLEPMALTMNQVNALRAKIREACALSSQVSSGSSNETTDDVVTASPKTCDRAPK